MKGAEAAVVVPGASEPDVPVEVLPVEMLPFVPPDISPTDGETLSGACAANLVKLSMVRDWFFAGLFRRTYKHMVWFNAEISVRYLRVDHSHHAILAMFVSRAIIPDG